MSYIGEPIMPDEKDKNNNNEELDFNIEEAVTEETLEDINAIEDIDDIDEFDVKKEVKRKNAGFAEKEDEDIIDELDLAEEYESELDESDVDESDIYDSEIDDDVEIEIDEKIDPKKEDPDAEVVLHFYENERGPIEEDEKSQSENMSPDEMQAFIDEIEKKLDEAVKTGKAPVVPEYERELQEFKEEPAYYEDYRDTFDALEKDRKDLKLDFFFSNDTTEYTNMMRSYEEFRELQQQNGAPAKELAKKFAELQELANVYYDKKTTEKQNTRKKNRMDWAQKITKLDNRYVVTAAYEAVDAQEIAGNKMIREAFAEDGTIDRNLLAEGVARHIVSKLLDRQIAGAGLSLTLDDVELMTDEGRINSSIDKFMKDQTYKDFINSFTDEQLRDMYSVNAYAAEDSGTDPSLLSSRLHQELLDQLSGVNHKIEAPKKEVLKQKAKTNEKVNEKAPKKKDTRVMS